MKKKQIRIKSEINERITKEIANFNCRETTKNFLKEILAVEFAYQNEYGWGKKFKDEYERRIEKHIEEEG